MSEEWRAYSYALDLLRKIHRRKLIPEKDSEVCRKNLIKKVSEEFVDGVWRKRYVFGAAPNVYGHVEKHLERLKMQYRKYLIKKIVKYVILLSLWVTLIFVFTQLFVVSAVAYPVILSGTLFFSYKLLLLVRGKLEKEHLRRMRWEQFRELLNEG